MVDRKETSVVVVVLVVLKVAELVEVVEASKWLLLQVAGVAWVVVEPVLQEGLVLP